MHEYSIVQALLAQCERYAKENDSNEITKVVIKLGVLSGVEPHLLEVAFDTFKEQTICHNAELIMQTQPLLLLCRCCHKESLKKEIAYLCEHCKSRDVEVLDGEEMYLMRLEMEEA